MIPRDIYLLQEQLLRHSDADMVPSFTALYESDWKPKSSRHCFRAYNKTFHPQLFAQIEFCLTFWIALERTSGNSEAVKQSRTFFQAQNVLIMFHISFSVQDTPYLALTSTPFSIERPFDLFSRLSQPRSSFSSHAVLWCVFSLTHFSLHCRLQLGTERCRPSGQGGAVWGGEVHDNRIH